MTRPLRWPRRALRPFRIARLRSTAALPAIVAFLVLAAPHAAADATVSRTTAPWTGEWHTFWRGGQALLALEQDGDRVSGTFTPGEGRIAGTVDGGVLSGEWRQHGSRGTFQFALSADVESFAGRFGNGEYWNGERVAPEAAYPVSLVGSDTPRQAFRTIVVAANIAADGDTAAALVFLPLLTYDGPPTDAAARQARRVAFYRLLDMSTFRLARIPDEDADGDGLVRFPIGPAGTDATFEVEMRQADDGRWRLAMPTMEVMEEATARFLAAAGADSYGDFVLRRRDSPRGAMRRFLTGVANWDGGGAQHALATMDLSDVPPALYAVNAPLFADYLRQIVDRVGYVVLQEIPDDPARAEPYVYYAHAAGDIVIDAERTADGTANWRFTSETIAATPAVFEAIQELPIAQGLSPPEPFSQYFGIRQWVKSVSPALLERDFLIARWQWIALAVTLFVALAAAALARPLVHGAHRFLPGTSAHDTADDGRHGLVNAFRLIVVGALCYFAFARIGLRTDVQSILATGAALVMLGGAVSLVYRLVGIVGMHFLERAQRTPGHVDEIVASVVTGVVKVAVLIGGIVFAADVVGLPYEGVVAGLGVGGLALAIAARDTVSNFFGAAVLLADRPFKRGDFVELDGRFAIVEDVGLRSSRLRLLDDALLVIPNARVADNSVVNYGRRRKRRILLSLSLTYDTPRHKLDEFVEALRDLLADFPKIDDEFYVGLNRFAASSVDIDLWCYVWAPTYAAQVELQHRLVGDILALAKTVGVSFAFPTRTLHVSGDTERVDLAPGIAAPSGAAGPKEAVDA